MIAVTGAAGFVGRHLVRALRERGLPVRALVRRADRRASSLRAMGCEAIAGEVSEPARLREALAGARAVIHLVAIIREHGRWTYQAVNVEGTLNVVEAARVEGVGRIIHLSALGARPDSTRYLRSKFAAEEAVRRAGVPYVIFRPSFLIGPDGGAAAQFRDVVMYGPWYPLVKVAGARGLFGRLADLTPVLPVLGPGTSRFVPMDIRDLVEVVLRSLDRADVLNETYEVGGPDVLTYDAMMLTVARLLRRRRWILHVPLPLARAIVRLFSLLPDPPITQDELDSLLRDNVCDAGRVSARFGVSLTPWETAMARALAG